MKKIRNKTHVILSEAKNPKYIFEISAKKLGRIRRSFDGGLRLCLRMTFLVILSLGFTSFSYAQGQQVASGECVVMPGHENRPQFHTDYHGERVYFCCKNCVKAFKKHPERYPLKPSKES